MIFPKSSGQTIIRKIIILFGLLIAVIIINAVYSMIHENRNIKGQISSNLNNKLEIASSVQHNELDKLKMISVSIKEQSRQFADYLDYDNIVPITMILRNINYLYPDDIDFIFLFDEDKEFLTSNITGENTEDTEQYKNLISDTRERIGIEEFSLNISVPALKHGSGKLKHTLENRKILCFKSLSHILHDTGDIYCYIVVIKIINNNKKLIRKMSEISGASVVYYDRNQKAVLSDFHDINLPYPVNSSISYQGKEFFTEQKDILSYAGQSIGKLIIAIDKSPFSDLKTRLLLSRILPFFASTVISLLLFLLLKFRVFNKIAQLIQIQRMVAEGKGDLSIRLKIPEKTDKKHLDEVEQMMIDFNLMMDKLEHTHTEVTKANERIMQSLEYANRIQSSLLPNPDEIRRFLPNSFFIWKPRDIVGGDIFYTEYFEHGFIIAVIDCTGHGVPGAFMTMIAVSALKRIVKDERCHNPAEILKRLNMIVKTTLQQDTDYALSDDGLDVGICFVAGCRTQDAGCMSQFSLTFAGAKIPLYFIRDNDLTIIKGDRKSIGYRRSELDFDFTNHTLDIEEGMSFYMATDGFTDQMGGEDGRRFGTERLKYLLKEISRESFAKQRDILVQRFEDYRGENERQDDMTVVGFGF